jgi:hypothetical protein
MNKPLSVLSAVFLAAWFAPVAHCVNVAGVNQKPWIINDAGILKSETALVIDNDRAQAFDAWVKISVAGKSDYMESIGNLAVGTNKKVVHVIELGKDGDSVTFVVYDNSDGKGTALCSRTLAQEKIRHWLLYVEHNSHLDIGYTDYQEDLKTVKWPGFWDQALSTDMPGSDTWPDESRVHLEAEGVYQLDTSLAVASADWFENLRERLRQGRFAFGAALANNAHSNWGAEELARSAYYADRFFKDKTGVGSSRNVIMRDEPTMSWGMIDAIAQSGARTFSIHHNADHNPWRGTTTYPELFYAQGKNPENKLLVWNSPVENYTIDELNFCDGEPAQIIDLITDKLMRYQSGQTGRYTAAKACSAGTSDYPYDVAMVNFTFKGDNRPMSPRVYSNIKAINDKGYVYPRLINANHNQFFDDLIARWSKSIPVYKGTIEDWWNFGAASTSYETAVNRMNHDKLASAESLATIAGVAVPGSKYPHAYIKDAYENMLLWDEHTWGSPEPAVDNQWRWKRNTAIASDVASTKILEDSMATINSCIPAKGKTVVVFNNLSWTRSDLATANMAGMPAHFDLKDVETGKAVKYQKLKNGTMVFVAENVPGLGYRTLSVSERNDEPVFETSVKTTANTIENRFFKVKFNVVGNITSILDKSNGSREIVDKSAPYPFNQYLILKEGILTGQVTSASVTTNAGAVMGCVTADGGTTGLDKLRRRVILYDSLDRIDVVNDAVKGQQLSNVETAYFSFPLNVNNFMLRHEMPTGDMRPFVNPDINDPANEQYYNSSTAFYTVNKWIDASNQRDWGVTFASLSAPLVSYGVPDTGCSKGGWHVNYNTSKPWIYSMAFNNEWQTNFQKTQPGRVKFRYSLHGHSGGSWQKGNAEIFGAETACPLKVSIIASAQAGKGLHGNAGKFIGVNKDNVVMTTAKIAEANGEGIILRFNEIKGEPVKVKVDLSWFNPARVIETDLIENDKDELPVKSGTVALEIPAFGFKTVRLVRGDVPQAVTGLAAAFNGKGCQITWKDQPDALYYEIFRGTSGTFTAGTGSYLATATANHYYDQSVKPGLKNKYYYTVRAVQAGKKSACTAAVEAVGGLPVDPVAPAAPAVTGEALHTSKITLSWQPASDNYAVAGYRVYRDGTQIADVAAVMNSWMDDAVKPATTYRYTVRAYDVAGNLSAESNPVVVKTTVTDGTD